MDVNKEVLMLVEEIKRLGEVDSDGNVAVKFVKLIDDERCSNIFEAIVGTLRAAKKTKVLDFEGEFLLKGAHDDTMIKLL